MVLTGHVYRKGAVRVQLLEFEIVQYHGGYRVV